MARNVRRKIREDHKKMKSVYTYIDPFKLKDDKTICDYFMKYPQFCASDTLVQGLIECYGRESFYIIQTVNDLQNTLTGSLTNSAAFDMQLFLDVSHEVRKCKNQILVNAFQNNMASAVESVKWLLLLGCDSSCFFERDKLDPEQQQLLDVYDGIRQKYDRKISDAIHLDKESVFSAIRDTCLKEAEFLVKRNMNKAGIEDYSCKNADEALMKLSAVEKKVKESLNSREFDDFSHSRELESTLRRVDFLNKLLVQIKNSTFEKVVIHGVHKFSPEILLLLTILEKVGIDIIFLINYADGLPTVYNTWRNVYEWTGCAFENVKKIDLSKGRPLGRDVANIYAGKDVSDHLDDECLTYENLSSFATDEVKSEFSKSGEQLGKMKVQYYAVDNSDTNEILKHYFPEQFVCKPFLSYPIGQFIMGIYRMWDFDNDSFVINESALRECVTSGIYVAKVKKSLVEIYELAWPYFARSESIEDAYDMLANLSDNLELIKKNKNLEMLRHISYYSLETHDIEILTDFLRYLEKLAKRIFVHAQEKVSFDNHFKNMISVLSEQINDSATINKIEKELVAQVWKALQEHNGDGIVGDFGDVREALAFYLSQKNVDDSSNWIVRNFEQIDGAVLLSKKTHARRYHFSLLSMRNMARTSRDIFPWPLSEEMFNGYVSKDLKNSMYACGVSVSERANFLKYSLFYGVFFSQRPISLSYVKSQNGEEQRPYYVLNLLNLSTGTNEGDKSIVLPDISDVKDRDASAVMPKYKEPEFEFFKVCNYKFFLNVVAAEPVIYRNDYQVKFFITNSLCALILADSRVNKNTSTAFVGKYTDFFRNLFPMYDDVAFNDIRKKVEVEVTKTLKWRENHPDHVANVSWYLANTAKHNRRKTNFLLAQWSDPDTGEDLMHLDRTFEKKEIRDYLCGDNLVTVMPHEVICENCCNNAKCLLSYYSRLREGRE